MAQAVLNMTEFLVVKRARSLIQSLDYKDKKQANEVEAEEVAEDAVAFGGQ